MLVLDAKSLFHLFSVFELELELVNTLEVAVGAPCDGLAQVDVTDYFRKLELLEVLGDLLHLIFRVVQAFVEVDGHEGRLDVGRCSHENFFQAGDTEGHVGAAVPGEMERVQCHLCGRLSNGLRGDGAHVLAWVGN